ncbi:MAG: homoserine dehydrogenase [Firmicutes bacterium]|nr:homoserine dehydrogenase [Bacillota bacterium]
MRETEIADMDSVQIGLLGCGTVGAGVVDLLAKRSGRILELTGLRPQIKRILVRDLEKPRALSIDRALLTNCVDDILNDPEIAVIIETIGGTSPAHAFVMRALEAGKHVITANKDMIAQHGDEILAAAARTQTDVLFEAAVGGAIPLIRPLKECLTANVITDLQGILNGTTNYILSKMTATGAEFGDVLQEAQDLGYAESDPSSDVDGLDAARKLAILASIAFSTRVRLGDIDVRGIRSITAADVRYASEMGAVIKLLATGSNEAGHVHLRVGPSLVPKDHPLARVDDAFNALFVHGDAAGDLMFFGRGAGSLPTASAIVGDVIEVLRNMRLGVSGRLTPAPNSSKPVNEREPAPAAHFIRLEVGDKPGVFAQMAALFAQKSISMESVVQRRLNPLAAEIAIVTHDVSAGVLARAMKELQSLPDVVAVHNVLPVLKGDSTS